MNSLQNKLDKIKNDLQSVIDTINGFESYDEMPGVDIDLLKQNILVSYEDIIRLNDNNINEVKEKTINEELEPEIEVEFIETIDDAPEDVKEYYKEVISERESEITEEKIDEVDKNEVISEPKTISIDSSVNSPLVGIFNEFSNNDDLASKLQFQAIKDVKTAISINDRVGFIKDIFEGNNDKFNSCLQNINDSKNIDSVITELNNKVDWDKENPVHISFLEIVYRKFL